MENIELHTISPEAEFAQICGAQSQAFKDWTAMTRKVSEAMAKADCDGAAIVQVMMTIREHFMAVIQEYENRSDAYLNDLFTIMSEEDE